MSVGLIIPIHNSATTLRQVFEALENQDYTLEEVMLIDNNSTDSSFGLMEEYQKRSKFTVKTVKQTRDYGLAHSYNQAIMELKVDLVITLQSDCVIRGKDGIKQLVQPFLRDDKVVASCSLQTTPWAVWDSYNFWQKCLFSRHVGRVASGRNGRFCCFSVKTLRKIGAFNEKRYRTAGEDGDLFIRLEEVGKVVDVDEVVDHLHSRSSKFSLRDYIYKENQLAEATGACLANNITRVSLLNYKTVLLRPFLVLCLFVPKINVFAACLIVFSSFYITQEVFKKEWNNYRVIFLPFINIFLFFTFALMFIKGFVTRNQTL